MTSGISLLLVAGAAGGTLMLRGASSDVLAATLSFEAAALLSTAMFFLGFLAIFAFVLGNPGG